MKIALAQIDARLGDIEGICGRIESQAVLAHAQGARVLCTPSPLFCGLTPGALIEEENFMHDLLSALGSLAQRLDQLHMVGLVPSVAGFDGAPLFEVFMLREGRVIPVRSLAALHRGLSSDEPWAPPVFDVDGVRMGVTFDLLRDVDDVPAGTDLMLFFQSTAFEVENEFSASVAAVPDGYYSPVATKSGMWIACMAPVGGFEDLAFTGGSFVMDDDGRVVRAAPCFEEALLVADIRRGTPHPTIDAHDLPQYRREAWLWDALRLHARDTVEAMGRAAAVVELTGDLPSTLAAALCVDALGPRHVVGVLVAAEDRATPEREKAEAERVARVRAIARGLGIRLAERTLPPVGRLLDRDEPSAGSPYADARVRALFLEDVAASVHALVVSPATKTHRALAAQAELASGAPGELAPFGDVCLTELEFIARERYHAGSAIPADVVSLAAVGRTMDGIVSAATDDLAVDRDLAHQARTALQRLDPIAIDGLIEDHVNRGCELERTRLGAESPAAAAILLMLIRRNEPARRRLPIAPLVSANAFVERAWPATTAWSDTGRHGSDPLTLADLVDKESERFGAKGSEHGERLRDEIMGIIAGMLGISPEQLDDAGVEQELLKRMQEGEGPSDGEGPSPRRRGSEPGTTDPGTGLDQQHGFRFFSPN